MLNFFIDHFEILTIAIFIAISLWSISRRNKKNREALQILEESERTDSLEPLSLHPHVDHKRCTGCGSCITACPEGDILQLINHQAVLVMPTKCVGHGECERVCPTSAINLVFGTKTRGMDIPRISSDYQTSVSGIYIAGELGGMGLIRNAVKQGNHAAQHALKSLDKNSMAYDYELVIVGAGPAGLAASLTAIAEKKSYLCFDQNSFGGTIANYPRQKIVMSAPLELPLHGRASFKSNRVSKEELLGLWDQMKRKYSLSIQERTKFEGFEKVGNIFHIKTQHGIVKAQKLILAMGVRGSPRRLGLKNEDLSKVTYNLVDPEQYQGANICVVGGGNAAVEAAQYLAAPHLRNRVTLLVRGSHITRANAANQKIIFDLAERQLVQILFNSSVKEIYPQELVIERDIEKLKIKNEYLFIFAGAEQPHKMLMDLGISIEKKFGTPLSRT